MKLAVYVLGREVAMLEQVGDFRSVLSYHAHAAQDDFISLTMPVRTESYVWDDPLPPVLQMNLPEGYLLQVLQEQFGPHVGASPVALLTVIGRNMIGRLQVAAPGAVLEKPAQSIEVAAILRGDNSEAAFAELVRLHATSGVSGVVPKFLDAKKKRSAKISLTTRAHIIKGATSHLPFITMNEHLCMQVVARVTASARTELSDDGHALVVHRFDVDQQGQPHRGMEDFCALLGLRSAAKYETTWERIARGIRDHVPGRQRMKAFRQLAMTLLLTHALRNADCHAKNLALLYTSRADVDLAPVYDMLTTSVYPAHQYNPPAIAFSGKKTWTPGKHLQTFITAQFGIAPREQVEMVEAISDAVADVAPQIRAAIKTHRQFGEIGKRMLCAWHEGVRSLRDQRLYALGEWHAGVAFKNLPDVTKQKTTKEKIGRLPLLGKR